MEIYSRQGPSSSLTTIYRLRDRNVKPSSRDRNVKPRRKQPVRLNSERRCRLATFMAATTERQWKTKIAPPSPSPGVDYLAIRAQVWL